MAIKRLPSTGDAPRSTGIPESIVPGGVSDSAGFPWAGRTFDHHETAFAGDDGETPEELRVAVEAVRNASGTEAASAVLAKAIADVVVELSRSRLMIPLLAEAGDIGVTPDGKTVEKTQELSIVTLSAPDGRRVMPAFTSVETMRTWNPEARPIPVPGPQVAVAAAQEGTDLVIIDPGTLEREFGVRRTQLEAMALGLHVVPAWSDAAVASAFQASVENDTRVLRIGLEPGDPSARLIAAETVVALQLRPGLGKAELSDVIARAQERWAADLVIAERVDSLRVVILSS